MKLLEDLLKVVQPIRYKGCYIYPEGNKWKVLGKVYDHLLSAKAAVDASYEALDKSRNRCQ